MSADLYVRCLELAATIRKPNANLGAEAECIEIERIAERLYQSALSKGSDETKEPRARKG